MKKITEQFIINDIIDLKKNGNSWEEAISKVKDANIVEDILQKSKDEYFRRLEEDQYIHSLS